MPDPILNETKQVTLNLNNDAFDELITLRAVQTDKGLGMEADVLWGHAPGKRQMDLATKTVENVTMSFMDKNTVHLSGTLYGHPVDIQTVCEYPIPGFKQKIRVRQGAN